MTNRRLVSAIRSLALLQIDCLGWRRHTQWVAAGKLRLLRVLGGELVSDAVE
jgi:hypothetical protein